MAPTTDFQLDFKGGITSLALLKLTRVFREMKSGQTLEVKGINAEARADMFRVLPAKAYEVLDMGRQEDGSYQIALNKR